MRVVEITIKGRRYPCYPTAGAMLRYRRMKGKEAQAIDLSDFDSIGTYLWCCCKSACVREEVDFPYKDDQSMMDCLLTEDIEAWGRSVSEANAEDDAEADSDEEDEEKKSPSE